MLKDYLLQNWALILILAAFAIVLGTTIFLERKVIRRMYILIGAIFVLSIVVFTEFRLEARSEFTIWRSILMAIRYSATPFIIAHIIFTLIKKQRLFVYIPAAVLTLIDFVSIFTGIVFSISRDNVFTRGPLGLLPYIVTGLYCVFLVYLLIKRSNKQTTEMIPILFLSLSFVTGLVLPFVIGKEYAQIFCTTIAIALFVYYVFSILQMSKKDPLTGLLNRQAYYADVSGDPKEITALISLDMNGLKEINDTRGHAAGDEALSTLAICFIRAARNKQAVYRVGGDEFIIVCRQTSVDETMRLVERIHKYVAETEYSCSIGYSFSGEGKKPVDELLKESDEMMYEEKSRHYQSEEKDRVPEA